MFVKKIYRVDNKMFHGTQFCCLTMGILIIFTESRGFILQNDI